MGRLFGTDGVRGIANRDLTGDLAYRLGRAAVVALTHLGDGRPEVLVGRDTRASGEFLEAALASGICSAGGDAVLLGVSTTPAVAFLTGQLGAQAGAVISASHNPAQYNGIKFFDAGGFKITGDVEDEIESIIDADRGPRPEGGHVGRIRSAAEGKERYLHHLQCTTDTRLDGLRIVVDCANGAASGIAPELFRRLGAEVVAIHESPDGLNINEGSGATVPETVGRAVVEHGADAGVAHDGDADRALFADHEGKVVDGDEVLAACALDLHGQGTLAGDLVVTTVMSNLGFRVAMRQAGIQVIETTVGDRYVLEELLRSGAVLGGEPSGHVIFRSHATTGDGLLTGVQFLSLAVRTGRTVADLASCMRRYPQVLLNVEVPDRSGLEGATEIWMAVREAEDALGDRGRVLVRSSGTEPVVRVMIEATSEEDARDHANAIAEAVRRTLR
jgi:phosphoglucosamine mutase